MSALRLCIEWFCVAACIYVATACFCRLGPMHPGKKTKSEWFWVYMAVMAVDLLLLTDIVGRTYSTKDPLIVAALAAYIHLTRRAWESGPAPIAQIKNGADT